MIPLEPYPGAHMSGFQSVESFCPPLLEDEYDRKPLPRQNRPKDFRDPFDWPIWKKWAVTGMACFITLIVGINGTSIAPAAEAINTTFGVSDENFPNSCWPVTSWNIGAAIMPLIVLPLMESYGVRHGYLLCYGMFVIFIIPQAVAPNFATLVVTRIIAGGCVGILENVTGGIISDIWKGEVARSWPMAVYVWTLLVGVTIGPVFGGIIIHKLTWRWIFYIQLILYVAVYPLVFLLIPETRRSVIEKRKAKANHKGANWKFLAIIEGPRFNVRELFQNCIRRPLHMLFTEVVVASFTLWSAFAFGTVFLFTQGIPYVYETVYHWPAYQAGIVQIAVVIGETIALFLHPPQNWLYAESARCNRENPGKPIPEARLYLSIVGSFFGLAAGLFWYAWTAAPETHWLLPTIALGFVGFGIQTIVTAASNYLTDSYANYAASALAAIAFGENMFSAFLPLATRSIYTTVGSEWASTLLAFIALILSCAPVVLMAFGRQIRQSSPFMSEAGQN